MAGNKKSNGSIVWAIDPFESRLAHRTPLAKAIQTLSRGLGGKVLPFSVVSPGGLAWPIPVSFAMGKDLEAFGMSAVKRDLQKLHVKNVETPTVEVREATSRRELADDVLRFAKKKNAGWIAVNTKRLLSPLPNRMGGFAEALIGKSALPVLAVSPKAKVSARFQRILFPTDFSPASLRAFRKTIALAARLNAEIILLNLEEPIRLPFNPPEMPLGIAEPLLLDAERARHQNHQRCAKRWAEIAAKSGVKCRFLSLRGTGSLSEAILRAAKRARADLICLMGKRSPSTPALLGGTVRSVISAARIPVLEIHQ